MIDPHLLYGAVVWIVAAAVVVVFVWLVVTM